MKPLSKVKHFIIILPLMLTSRSPFKCIPRGNECQISHQINVSCRLKRPRPGFLGWQLFYKSNYFCAIFWQLAPELLSAIFQSNRLSLPLTFLILQQCLPFAISCQGPNWPSALRSKTGLNWWGRPCKKEAWFTERPWKGPSATFELPWGPTIICSKTGFKRCFAERRLEGIALILKKPLPISYHICFICLPLGSPKGSKKKLMRAIFRLDPAGSSLEINTYEISLGNSFHFN